MNRIRELREEMGAKQSWLAAKLHLNQTAISKYELEIRDPSVQTIHQLCDLFNCSADYLLGRSPDRGGVSQQDLEMLAAYRAAPYSIQGAITMMLSPYVQGGEKSKTTPGETAAGSQSEAS